MATRGVSSSIAKLLRLASWLICLIVIASFTIFVVDQTSAASTHQQEALHGGGNTSASGTSTHKSSVHKTIDEASDFFTSPFTGIISGSNSQWLIRGVKTVLALLVYGFALSYLARVIRVRL